MMRQASVVPPWLEPLLSAHFFTSCPLHPDAPRGECNMFCLDCASAAASFCFHCRSDCHFGHRVIQIRRSSYHDVVRVEEIQKELDISGVQTYVINSARVLFLNERPQPRRGRRGAPAPSFSSPHTCEICARFLLDPLRFCSLGCKLAGVKRNADASLVMNNGDKKASGGGGELSSEEKEEAERWGGGSCEGMGHDAVGPAPPPAPNTRRRKGIPRRAPFAS